jgi:Ca-activated chloride channel family protein
LRGYLRPRTLAGLAAGLLLATACSSGAGDTAGDAESAVAGAHDQDGGAASQGPAPEDGATAGRFPTDVTFADYGVGQFVPTAELATSTFATDADTASFTLAQAWLEREGVLPPAEAIRVEEWVNAVDHRYPDPPPGETWAIHTDLGTPAWTAVAADAPTQLLRVGLQAARAVERAPVSVTLVIDTSGSMATGDRLGLVQEAAEGLLAQLGPDDQVAVVEYGSDARVVSHPTAAAGQVREAVASLTPDGSTNAEAGIALGYDLARSAYREGATNTVVLFSDGVANVGRTGPEAILSRIETEAEDGIVLHSVGVGMDNFNDVLLERLANDSGGGYAYIERDEEAASLFLDALPVLAPIAQDVKAQVALDPAAVSSWRLIGYENRLLHAEELRDDRVGGGFVGAGHAVTALYEVVRAGEAGNLGSVTVRWDEPASGEVSELSRPITVDAAVTGIAAKGGTDPSVTFDVAAAVAAAAEGLRGSRHVEVDLAEVVRRLEATGDVQAERFVALIAQASGAAQPVSPPRRDVSPPGIDVEDRTGS